MLKSFLNKALLSFAAAVVFAASAQETKPGNAPNETKPAATVEKPAAAPEKKAEENAVASPAPAAEKAVSDPDQRNIRFQFEGIPYMDVVQRFSQMANKPLIAETNIEGTVTFNDPKPYSYQQAFETLNTILSMKNVMLV